MIVAGETDADQRDEDRIVEHFMFSHEEPQRNTHPPPLALVTPNKDNNYAADDAVTLLCGGGEIDEASCSDMLDTVDSCVGCVNQIALQHDFEDSLAELPLQGYFRSSSEQHMSATEASLIRLQLMESSTKSEAALPDNMDLINLCGSVHDEMNTVRSPPCARQQKQQQQPAPLEAAAGSSEKHQHRAANAVQCAAAVADSVLLSSPPSSPMKCTICMENTASVGSSGAPHPVPALTMPCCREAGVICTVCIRSITYPITAADRVGRCPCCRSWFTAKPAANVSSTTEVEVELEIAVIEPVADQNCGVCNQVKDCMVLVQNNNDESICDACFLGRRHPLKYECQSCSARQCIPHPMYRYQAAPEEFGTTVQWTCQGDNNNNNNNSACKSKFTHWRICTDQLGMIPVADAPPCWGEDYSALTVARRRRAQERWYAKQDATMQPSNDEECVIL